MSAIASEHEQALRRHAAACLAQGFERPVLALSFDCDTPEDAQAALDLFPRLEALDVPATFAVPGAQLQAQAPAYQRLAAQGARFINHGARPHAEPHPPLYRGITFYNELTPEAVIDDIRQGHAIVRAVLGLEAEGFRAPHFGCFQQPDQLRLIHETGRDLGYTFCSTTVPALGLVRGGRIDTGLGLWELPVSGSLGAPDTPLDSWNYLRNHEEPSLASYVLKPDYARELLATVDFFLERDLPAVLNYYVDPAHVVGSDLFLTALAAVRERGVAAVPLAALARPAPGSQPASRDAPCAA